MVVRDGTPQVGPGADGAVCPDAARADDEAFLPAIYDGVLRMAGSGQWEQRLGALRVAHAVLLRRADPTFALSMVETCSSLLEDDEVRVRWAVGEVLRVLAEQLGIQVWELTRDRILGSICRNFVSASLPCPLALDCRFGAGCCL